MVDLYEELIKLIFNLILLMLDIMMILIV